MALIVSHRHLPEDLAFWEGYVTRLRREAVLRRRRLGALVARSRTALESFGADCWVGVSWGKDSTVLLDLVQRFAPDLPVCWVITAPGENPDCWAVRDQWPTPLRIHEYVDAVEVDDGYLAIRDDEPWPPCADFGHRYVTGLRADESRTRARRARLHSENSTNTSAPLTWWTGADVLAYLLLHDLPIHPAYGMTRGGLLDPQRLRVAPIGGVRGTGIGRRDWERFYYADILDQVVRHGPT